MAEERIDTHARMQRQSFVPWRATVPTVKTKGVAHDKRPLRASEHHFLQVQIVELTLRDARDPLLPLQLSR